MWSFSDSKPFRFLGAGSPLFSQPGATEKNADEEGEIACPDIYGWLPVQLPEVEVKTGEEEDEDCVYSQHANLFRFDGHSNQWTERGIGEMKILKHKDTGQLMQYWFSSFKHTFISTNNTIYSELPIQCTCTQTPEASKQNS